MFLSHGVKEKLVRTNGNEKRGASTVPVVEVVTLENAVAKQFMPRFETTEKRAPRIEEQKALIQKGIERLEENKKSEEDPPLRHMRSRGKISKNFGNPTQSVRTKESYQNLTISPL